MIANRAEYVDRETAEPSQFNYPDGRVELDQGSIVPTSIATIPVKDAPLMAGKLPVNFEEVTPVAK